ncbi:MAG: hypothetical protein JXJ20_06840 [Anaerolineae bacterium]|nr:hypothetical protein [Anaerolineae bacterium]
MEETLRDFEKYLKRRYRESSTPKHYISVIGSKNPDVITALDIDAFVEHQVAAELSQRRNPLPVGVV